LCGAIEGVALVRNDRTDEIIIGGVI